MNATKTAELTTGSVVSRDGTQIGYLRVGHGPAVVLHGSNESARSHLTIALALAGRFTVYLPDRCGRGMSGPHDGIRTEVVDLEAILVQSGAELVFGVSAGGLGLHFPKPALDALAHTLPHTQRVEFPGPRPRRLDRRQHHQQGRPTRHRCPADPVVLPATVTGRPASRFAVNSRPSAGPPRPAPRPSRPG